MEGKEREITVTTATNGERKAGEWRQGRQGRSKWGRAVIIHLLRDTQWPCINSKFLARASDATS